MTWTPAYAEMEQRLQELENEVSQYRSARRVALDNEGNYRILFDNAADLIVVIDPEGIILDLNRRFEEESGFSRSAMIGKSILTAGLITPDSVKRIGRHIETMLAGNPAPIFEIKGLRRKGGHVPYEVRAVPIRKSGKIVSIQAILRNLSLRRRAEQALGESEDRFRSMFQTIPDPVTLIRTEDGRCVDVNEGFLRTTGYGRDEVVGKTTDDLDIWQDPNDRLSFIEEIFRSGEVRNLESKFRCRDGRIIEGLFSAKEVLLKNIPHIISITRDITSLKQAQREKEKLEAQLRQARKMEAIGTLAGGLAHDFNNLLMGIQGVTSLMLLDTDSKHPNHEHLKEIEDHVKSAADLTRQLLGFARTEKYEVKPVDLNDVLQRTSAMFGRTRKEIAIDLKLQDNLWTAEVDRKQIEQVLLNIYVNAWQAMPDGGNLLLQTRNTVLSETFVRPCQICPGHYIELSLTDTGVGMEPDTKDRIFDPFFTTKEMGRGTGLGLWSAYGIIKNHGGIIRVHSRMGEGTTFRIYLPRSTHPLIEENPPPEVHIKGRETLLVVDDERIILNAARRLLEQMGYRVITAGSGREAVKAYREKSHEIALVILDIIMPVMGGGETVDELKKINRQVKVLVASGYNFNDQVAEIMNRGCQGFIQKPFTLNHLSIKIREILDGNATLPAEAETTAEGI